VIASLTRQNDMERDEWNRRHGALEERPELHIHEHVAAFKLDRINIDFVRRIVAGLAGCEIIFPAMPGAYNFSVFNHAFGKRSAFMQAYIVYRADGPIDSCNAQRFAAAEKFFGFSLSR
jgi:hypothetical protein